MKNFLKYKRNTYLRFRINYSWENDYSKKGEAVFNEILMDFTNRKQLSCYVLFILEWASSDKQILDFLDKYQAKVIVTQSNQIAGIKFSDAKYKEMFLLRYREYFPDSSLIK